MLSQLKGWVIRNKVLWCLLLLAHLGSLAALRSGYMNKFSILTYLLTVIILLTVAIFWVVNKYYPQNKEGVVWTPEELHKRGYLVHDSQALRPMSLLDSEAATLAGSMKQAKPLQRAQTVQPFNQSAGPIKDDRVLVGTGASTRTHGGAKSLKGVGHLNIPRELV